MLSPWLPIGPFGEIELARLIRLIMTLKVWPAEEPWAEVESPPSFSKEMNGGNVAGGSSRAIPQWKMGAHACGLWHCQRDGCLSRLSGYHYLRDSCFK